MTTELQAGHIERFRSTVARRFGLQFEDTRLSLLAEVLRRRVEESGGGPTAYLDRLEAPGAPRPALEDLADDLTVGETYFFRHMDQLRAFSAVVLSPALRDRRPLRILSAGCASGEEPYSLAMLALEKSPDAPCPVQIRALDLNPAALARARAARYPAWSLRETPPELAKRWFRQVGREFQVLDPVRACVTFEERNLCEEDSEIGPRGFHDVVFCRNVMMYFTPDAARALVARIQRALAPGGYLFLGHAETLRGLSHDFHLRHTHGAFYYQRREGAESGLAVGEPAAEAAGAGRPEPAVEWADTWVETIRSSSERIRALAEQRADGGGSAGRAPAVPAPPWELGLILDLLKRERFDEALGLLRALPPASQSDPDVRLLEAVLLTNAGQLQEAEAASRELLRIDELNAGAHFVLALCREGQGDRAGAFEEDQVAVYLAPDFAMARLHLGLLGLRKGDRLAARHELDRALDLLQQEDASRLLLFGGGFSREALVALCRAKLLGCEEKA